MTSWQALEMLENIANELKNIREILEKQSTTEQSSMVGERVNDLKHCGWTCTNCNYHDGNKTDNYCPNCGAKMKG